MSYRSVFHSSHGLLCLPPTKRWRQTLDSLPVIPHSVISLTLPLWSFLSFLSYNPKHAAGEEKIDAKQTSF